MWPANACKKIQRPPNPAIKQYSARPLSRRGELGNHTELLRAPAGLSAADGWHACECNLALIRRGTRLTGSIADKLSAQRRWVPNARSGGGKFQNQVRGHCPFPSPDQAVLPDSCVLCETSHLVAL